MAALVRVDELDDLKAQLASGSTYGTRDHGWTAPPGAFLELTRPRAEFAPVDGIDAVLSMDQLSYLKAPATAPGGVRSALLCLPLTSPYTALTGRPVGRVRGGPARAFDAVRGRALFGDRRVYHVYQYSISQTAVRAPV